MSDSPHPRDVSYDAAVDVSIIIVSYNVRDLLRRCLESIRAHTEGIACEVIVVDNASSDASADMIRREFPDARLIESVKNRGYGGGVNLGATSASGRYLLALNPDTEVLAGAISRLACILDEDGDLAIAGPCLRYPDGTIQSSRRRFPTPLTALVESTVIQRWWPNSPVLRRYYLADRPDVSQDVDWLVGACFLMRRRVFEAVRGFDEQFEMYSEELDLCRKVRDSGWKIRYEPSAMVIHHEGRSSEQNLVRRARQFNESKSRYVEKYFGRGVGRMLRVALIASTCCEIAEETVKLLVGHRRNLRSQRIRALGLVVADQCRRLFGSFSAATRSDRQSSAKTGRRPHQVEPANESKA